MPRPEWKSAWVEIQIHGVMVGRAESIVCSYCGFNVISGGKALCYASMDEAVAILLQRMETNCVRRTDGFRVFPQGLTSIAEADETTTGSEMKYSLRSIR
jgi:hypothetical protein